MMTVMVLQSGNCLQNRELLPSTANFGSKNISDFIYLEIHYLLIQKYTAVLVLLLPVVAGSGTCRMAEAAFLLPELWGRGVCGSRDKGNRKGWDSCRVLIVWPEIWNNSFCVLVKRLIYLVGEKKGRLTFCHTSLHPFPLAKYISCYNRVIVTPQTFLA